MYWGGLTRPALVALYVVVGTAWILGSDRLLGSRVDFVGLSIVKGLAFVVVTGGLLALLLGYADRQAQIAVEERVQQARMIEQLAEGTATVAFRYVIDEMSRFDYVSSSVTNLSGYTPEEMVARPELAEGLLSALDLTQIEDIAASRQPTRTQVRLRHRGGGTVWADVDIAPVYEGDELVALEGMARDVTVDMWQRRVDEAFGRVHEPIETGVSAAQLHEMIAEELVDVLSASTVNIDVHRRPPWTETTSVTVGPGGPGTTQVVEAKTFDRDVRLQVTAPTNPHQDELHDVLGQVAHRLALADAAVSGQQRLRLLLRALQASASAVIITDANGAIEWVNNGFEELTGYSLAETIGHTPRLLKSGRQDTPFYADMWETITQGITFAAHVVNQRKDGSLYDASITIDPVVAPDGSIEAFVGIQRDVTAENANRERLHAMELVALMRDRELQEDRAILVQTLSHELRTPLTVLLGASKTLAAGNFDGSQRHALVSMAERASTNLLNRLDELTQVSYDIDTAVSISVNELVDSVLEGLNQEELSRLHVQRQPRDWTGAVALARAAIRPIVHNALKFSPASSPVELSVTFDDDKGTLIVDIVDHGPGIPGDVLGHLDDPFHQLDQSTTRGHGGLGLGLFSASRAARRTGGGLDIESHPHGTSVRISLPALSDGTVRSRSAIT